MTLQRRHLVISAAAALAAPTLALAQARPIRLVVPYAPGGPIDVTARRRSDRARAEMESLYRTMFEANPHAMWLEDRRDGRLLAVYDGIERRPAPNSLYPGPEPDSDDSDADTGHRHRREPGEHRGAVTVATVAATDAEAPERGIAAVEGFDEARERRGRVKRHRLWQCDEVG